MANAVSITAAVANRISMFSRLVSRLNRRRRSPVLERIRETRDGRSGRTTVIFDSGTGIFDQVAR
jgi:hypothetical protein